MQKSRIYLPVVGVTLWTHVSTGLPLGGGAGRKHQEIEFKRADARAMGQVFVLKPRADVQNDLDVNPRLISPKRLMNWKGTI